MKLVIKSFAVMVSLLMLILPVAAIDAPPAMPGEASGGFQGGGSSAPAEWNAVKSVTTDETSKSKEIVSTGADENAVNISNGAKAIFNDMTLTRTSNDSTGGDSASFFGVGAALLATDGTAYINGGSVTTDSAGGAGLFAYNKGTVYAAGATINTSADTSGGIHAAGGGKLYAWGLDVTTDGNSSAAIRSDRGGGTMVVDGGNYTSLGLGSPAVYCTADIAVNNAFLKADTSEGICLEGKNSLKLFDCELTSTMSDDEQNDCTWSVIVYQSMSGDSETGKGTFSMQGGSLISKNGGIIYTTNTSSDIYMSGVDITAAEDCEFFLKCTGNKNARGWGSVGQNGAECNFTASSQQMSGDVIYDSISKLDFYMLNASSLTGAIKDDESAAGEGGSGYCNAYIDPDSIWIVTENSTLNTLHNAGRIVDIYGKSVTIKGTDGTVYNKGESSVTVTAESYIFNSIDTSGAGKASDWKTYEVDKPASLTAELLGKKTEVTSMNVQNSDLSTTLIAATANDALNSSNDQTVIAVAIVAVVLLIMLAVVIISVKNHKEVKKATSDEGVDGFDSDDDDGDFDGTDSDSDDDDGDI